MERVCMRETTTVLVLFGVKMGASGGSQNLAVHRGGAIFCFSRTFGVGLARNLCLSKAVSRGVPPAPTAVGVGLYFYFRGNPVISAVDMW